jgi:hypothetical protein
MTKNIFISLIFIHGIIHFLGFARAFNIGNVAQFISEIQQSLGILWLMTCILYIICAILLQLKKDIWIWFAFIAVGFSQILII